MENNIYLKLEQLFDHMEINMHELKFIKENVEKIKKLNESTPFEHIKTQIFDILKLIYTFLLIPVKDERDNKIKEEYKKAKKLLYSVPIQELNEFQHRLEKTNIDDFRIINHDGANLTIAGSFDFCYYHEVELDFIEVEYICCPTYIKADTFRVATDEEVLSFDNFTRGNNILGGRGIVFCLEDKSFGDKYYVIAHGLKVNWGIVYYYQREDLKSGERIASWVEK